MRIDELFSKDRDYDPWDLADTFKQFINEYGSKRLGSFCDFQLWFENWISSNLRGDLRTSAQGQANWLDWRLGCGRLPFSGPRKHTGQIEAIFDGIQARWPGRMKDTKESDATIRSRTRTGPAYNPDTGTPLKDNEEVVTKPSGEVVIEVTDDSGTVVKTVPVKNKGTVTMITSVNPNTANVSVDGLVGNEETDTTDDTTLLAKIVDVLGKITGCFPNWSKQSPGTITATDALRTAKAWESSVLGVGNIAKASITAFGPRWAYWNGKNWKLAVDCGLFGIDLTPDVTIPNSFVGTARAGEYPPPNQADGNIPDPTTGPGGEIPDDMVNESGLLSLFGGGTAPKEITVRRCPGPYRMAINERCYHKDVLPDKFRLNKPKPAPVSHADAANIRKAKQAVKRIATYAKKHVEHVIHEHPHHHHK